MRLVKAHLAYDGTAFNGWQVQKKGETAQGTLERVLQRIHGRPVRVTAASRTDRGVHAEGQVVHFESDVRLSDRILKKALNSALPPAIAVLSLRTMRTNFNARFDARSKVYRYTIEMGSTKPIFRRSFVHWVPRPLQVTAMQKGAKFLVGTHDFSSFCASAGKGKNPVRTIRRLRILKKGKTVAIEISADAFLTHMARIITGTLLEVGRGRMKPEEVRVILDARDRRKAGPTAPARGLTLVRVFYP